MAGYGMVEKKTIVFIKPNLITVIALGYEVEGLENISSSEPILFVYYHGAIPIDVYYFITKVFLYKNRLVHTVADHFLFKIPGNLCKCNPQKKESFFLGFAIIAECMKVIPGTVQSCANVLKEGNLLAISPGGVYESQFSHQYTLMWKKRLGFAKVALEAKVVSGFRITIKKNERFNPY